VADPRLKAIADAVLTRIEGITIAGGYNFNAGDAGRYSGTADESTEMPAAYITGVGFEERHMALATDGPNAREATALLTLRLITIATGTPQQEIEKWAYDITKAVEGLPIGLGLAYVISVMVRSFTPMVTEPEIQKPYGMANMVLAVTYRMARGEL